MLYSRIKKKKKFHFTQLPKLHYYPLTNPQQLNFTKHHLPSAQVTQLKLLLKSLNTLIVWPRGPQPPGHTPVLFCGLLGAGPRSRRWAEGEQLFQLLPIVILHPLPHALPIDGKLSPMKQVPHVKKAGDCWANPHGHRAYLWQYLSIFLRNRYTLGFPLNISLFLLKLFCSFSCSALP